MNLNESSSNLDGNGSNLLCTEQQTVQNLSSPANTTYSTASADSIFELTDTDSEESNLSSNLFCQSEGNSDLGHSLGSGSNQYVTRSSREIQENRSEPFTKIKQEPSNSIGPVVKRRKFCGVQYETHDMVNIHIFLFFIFIQQPTI